MPPDREPTRDELLAMAYADGELAEPSRREFESRLLSEPPLARLVAEHRALDLLARHAAPAEPIDAEWRRLERDPIVRGSTLAGWALLVGGALGLCVFALASVWSADVHWLVKALVLGATAGLALLLGVTVRARIATLPYDPYRKVER